MTCVCAGFTYDELEDVIRDQVKELEACKRSLERARAAQCQRITTLRGLVAQQAEDAGLWFKAATAPEAYLQQELRRLHTAFEDVLP
jgi:hypothetical protein